MRMKHTVTLIISLCALVVALNSKRARAVERQDDRVSLAEARTYMVELINRDRSVKGLNPVTLDPIATEAAQRHAEEMVRYRFLAHYNRDGKLPDQRYTEAGGTGYVQENVYLDDRYEKGFEPAAELTLEPNPTFTRREVEEVEAAYFNQYPGRDSHRRNVLNTHHSSVGIGLARATGAHTRALANAQEFVCADGEIDPLPGEAKIGQKIVLSGRIREAARLHSIEIGRFPLPEPLTRAQLLNTHHYPIPPAFKSLPLEDSDSGIRQTSNGRFSCFVTLSDESRPGVYYLRALALANGGKPYIAAQRTVVVK